MIHENEIVMLLLGASALIFIAYHRNKIKRIRAVKWLIASFGILVIAYISTFLEEFLFHDQLNLIEHLCYAASSILLCVWCWIFFVSPNKNSKQ